MNRTTIEGRFARFDLVLSPASEQTRMEAAGRYEDRLPRWEVSDGRHRSTVKGFPTLAAVETYLDEVTITRGM